MGEGRWSGILDHFAWRLIYLLPIPASLLAVAFAARLLTDSRAPGSRRLDRPGQITAALAITALVYGIIQGGAESFTEPKVMVVLSTAAVAAVAFVLLERAGSSPMPDLALFRSPAFTATALIAMISFLGLIGFFFALSLYFAMVQRLSTLDAAWCLLYRYLSKQIGALPGVQTVETALSLRRIKQLTYEPTR
ncbi:hypothetical protein AVL59_19540 [Streptomyces griseochromogenes]|uniref:Major facilitator superfamily (MFS) profile domain-containing protein n=1 Tax=Streptomyces griseochromogenes TaxID=68214 RepID=A0A1B1AY87_9ACTN|nr:hypothetical protein AVL59_19540 [Streptomyces griseochromogenes]